MPGFTLSRLGPDSRRDRGADSQNQKRMSESIHHARVRRIARTFAIIPIISGFSVIAGWALDVQVLKSILPGIVNMNPVTATTFIVAGTALSFVLASRAPFRRAAVACSALVMAIGLLRLGCYATGIDLGMDAWLFHAAVVAVPGRNA